MNGAGHSNELRGVLRSLARLEPGPAVVSAYLNTRWDDEHQRERLRLTVKDHVRRLRGAYDGHPDEEELGETLDRLERFVSDVVNQADQDLVSVNGLAVFASTARKLWVVYQSPVEFDTEVTISDRPRLLPLARQHDDYENAFVVSVDPRHLRIYEVFLGGVVTSAELDQYLPDQVDVGGQGHQGSPGLPRGGALSQMRFQRHVDAHREMNLRNAADFLRRLAEHEQRAHVVLAGDHETVQAFKALLPANLLERVIDEPARVDDKDPQHVVVARALQVLQRHERRSEDEGVARLVGLALSGNLGVLGPEDTLMALNEERVYRLYINGDGRLGAGWRCLDCHAVGQRAHAGCPYCSGRTTTVDLAEEMVRKAVDTGAFVEHVRHSVKLSHFGGMGATLRHGRQPRSAGLAHAEHFPLPPE